MDLGAIDFHLPVKSNVGACWTRCLPSSRLVTEGTIEVIETKSLELIWPAILSIYIYNLYIYTTHVNHIYNISIYIDR